MPIYAYRCESCGFEKDVLQKISDAPLTQCPSCGKDAFRKQVTAAGFQLKGSGWYVTDFRGGNGGKGGAKADAKAPADAPAAGSGSTSGESAKAGGESASAAAPATASTAGPASSGPAGTT